MSQSAIVSMLETNSSAKRTFRMFDSDLIIATMDYFYNKTLTFATHIQEWGGVGSDTNIPKFVLNIFREILEKNSKYLPKIY